ncbi:MAG: FtsX-like permease family protein [Muribaculaceae bacterium]
MAKKTHSAVNIISIISMCGVVVTTAALVCVLSVFNGFASLIGGKLSMLDPQIAITATQGKVIEHADSVIGIVAGIDGVKVAIPTVEDHCLALFGDYQTPVRVKGVPQGYDSLTSITPAILEGEFLLDDSVSRYGVLSIGTALQLRARPGFIGQVRIFAPQRRGSVNLANPMGAFRADSVFVAAVYQIEQSDYDRDLIFVPLDMAQFLFDCQGEASTIEVTLQPHANEQAVMTAITSALGNGYTVKNRLMQQAASFRMVNIEKWVTFLLLGFIMIIATFNVISTLSLLIIEKDESIRTLRYLGATNKQITSIFVAEGWLISLTGAVLGVSLGLLLCWLQQEFGLIALQGNGDNLIVRTYPVEIQLTDVAIVFALVAAVGLLTSIVTSAIMRRRLPSSH